MFAVTGANGHLGSTLCRLLAEKGHDVRALVRTPHSKVRTSHLPSSVAITDYSLLNEESVAKALRGAKVIFHTAAPTVFWSNNVSEITRPILEGTLNVIRAAARTGVEKVIMTSSCSAVGFHTRERPLSEDDFNWETKHPQFQAKLRAEVEASALAEDLGVRLVRVCPPSILGPGFGQHSPSTKPYGLLLQGRLKAIPRLSYHIVDVRDLAAAQLSIGLSKTRHNRYIIAGEYMTPEKLLDVLAQLYPALQLPKMVLGFKALGFFATVDAIRHQLTMKRGSRHITWDLVRECAGCEQKLSIRRWTDEFPEWSARPISATIKDTIDWITNGDF